MKLGLGTVQFGLDYGIIDSKGQIPFEETGKIIQTAKDNKVEIIDTATLYGQSEIILGQIIKPEQKFKLVTKTPSFTNEIINISDADMLEHFFFQSLNNLKRNSIYGLMIHHSKDLFKPKSELLYQKMCELKKNKLVEKIGVSIYTSDDINKILENYDIDIIQLPINIFDQRLIQTRHLEKLKSKGVEIHARSVFLQGLLLEDPYKLDSFFDPIKLHINEYRQTLLENNITPLQSALAFVNQINEIDYLICGVKSNDQFNEILNSISKIDFDWQKFCINEEKFINPTLWMPTGVKT